MKIQPLDSHSSMVSSGRILYWTNNGRIRSLLTIFVLIGVPLFMVWWQVFDSPLSDAKLHPEKDGEFVQQSHSTELPVVSDTRNQDDDTDDGDDDSDTSNLFDDTDDGDDDNYNDDDSEEEEEASIEHQESPGMFDNQTLLPSMVWLMSFPNSGTSYTMRMVQSATQHAVATNYGAEFTSPPRPNFPVYPVAEGDPQEGPFWKGEDADTHPLPSKYILTKTHCGGRCVRCNQRNYISTLPEFTNACTAGRGCLPSSDGSCEWKDTYYPAPPYNTRLAKTIHLIRNPFDNIVSRFHLAHKKRSQDEPDDYQTWKERYPANATGFANWCIDLDREYGSPFNPKKVRVGSLTCHGEWFKYVQWHVLALATIKKSQLPSMTVYYEDYEAAKWNATVQRIVDFLELPLKGNNVREFESHTSYEYYTDQQRREARDLVRKMVVDQVWELLKHYFD
jgi:Sulfotransferase domain